MSTSKEKKIKIKPARHESFEATLERHGQGRLFNLENIKIQAKKKKEGAKSIRHHIFQ